jgi:hypothetical protein
MITNATNTQFVDFALLHCVVTAAYKCWYLRIRATLKHWREHQLKGKYMCPEYGDCLACGWCSEYPQSHFQWRNVGCKYLCERYIIAFTEDGDIEYKTRCFGDDEMMICCPYPQ